MQNALIVPNFQGIIFTGKPRQYRADCQSGQFKIGATKLIGKSLDLEILGWQIIEDEFFNYEHQPWLELIFIDPQNIVSHILCKTESLDNFTNLALDIGLDGCGVGEGITTAVMSPRTSAKNSSKYYAIEFAWRRSTPERLIELADFVSTLQIERLSINTPELSPDLALPV